MDEDEVPAAERADDDDVRVSRRGLLGGAAAGGLGLAALLQSAGGRQANAQSRDDVPVPAFFALEVEGVSLGAFVEVAGIGSESETVQDGGSGRETGSHSAPSTMKWGDIELKRGLTSDMTLWDWRKQAEEGKVRDVRKNGSIVLYDQTHSEVARWNFTAAWPSKIRAGHAKLLSDDVMIIEEFTLVPGSMKRVR